MTCPKALRAPGEPPPPAAGPAASRGTLASREAEPSGGWRRGPRLVAQAQRPGAIQTVAPRLAAPRLAAIQAAAAVVAADSAGPEWVVKTAAGARAAKPPELLAPAGLAPAARSTARAPH